MLPVRPIDQKSALLVHDKGMSTYHRQSDQPVCEQVYARSSGRQTCSAEDTGIDALHTITDDDQHQQQDLQDNR